jgi:hypothetical protein
VSSTIPRRAAAALVLLAAVALVGSSRAGAGEATPDSALLDTYQPVLVFHPAEAFRPTKVQSFVGDSELEQFIGGNPVLDSSWTVVDPDPEPGELPQSSGLYRLDQIGCEADSALAGRACYADAWAEGSGGGAVYGRVVRTETHVVLQYWLFYYDNPLVLPTIPGVGTFWQSHEGDWEVVNVVLDSDEQPVEAAYSQHCLGQRKTWGAVTKSPAGSTHPVAYVALGSHANYFGQGVGPLGAIPINPQCIPPAVPTTLRPFVVDQVLDGSGVGAVVGPPGTGIDHATIHRIEGETWSTFGGRWGESEYFFTPVPLGPGIPAGAIPFGLAPASPANQSNWDVSTILAWPTSS